MKYLDLLMVFCIVLLFSACEHPLGGEVFPISRIWVQNNSSKTIVSHLSFLYPDTSMPDTQNRSLWIAPGERLPYDSTEKWETVISGLPADTLSVFFYSYDTLNKYGFQQLRASYNILKRKDISYDDVVKNNYTIEYP